MEQILKLNPTEANAPNVMPMTFWETDLPCNHETRNQILSCHSQSIHVTSKKTLYCYCFSSPSLPKECTSQGLIFSSHGSSKITSYCNADWASRQSTRRSIFGYYVFLGSSLISWKSNKQPIVSCSYVKAEYRAIAAITGELTWLRYLLGDLCIEHLELAKLFCDNQAAIHIAENSVFHDHKSA